MIFIKYSIFAIISTIVNLAFQYLSFYFYSGCLSLYIAIFWGTLFGLIVKYILDKNFIFYDTSKKHSKKFALYSIMGILTTAIFCGTEIAFDHLFDLKYTGAVVGLSIGYIIKYFLDKKYVFETKQ
ncbi:MAG: Unknown protein [uncultured Campylobacterales bacterium]|uniref:GtrA/DPMS transmembrane domain-containing protein n=1 Tax=uncultured Campylobacterales bacterium TaxID=352960 RepID=A0A6S6SAK1_9BACT|nr:MAG: Unknown protein [uncultured Campylobacterales bacterium]